MYLCSQAEGEVVLTPSDAVDQCWHLHMTYTKSYWYDFCGEVIGKDMHHNPTKGGEEQLNFFNDTYTATLGMYKSTFGETARNDIWPKKSIRFGKDALAVRVHSKRYMVLQRLPFRIWTVCVYYWELCLSFPTRLHVYSSNGWFCHRYWCGNALQYRTFLP